MVSWCLRFRIEYVVKRLTCVFIVPQFYLGNQVLLKPPSVSFGLSLLFFIAVQLTLSAQIPGRFLAHETQK